MNAVFDTLSFSEEAQRSGFSKVQADFQAKQFAKKFNDFDDQLVTNALLDTQLKLLKSELIIKLGGLMVVCSGVIIAVLGFILKH